MRKVFCTVSVIFVTQILFTFCDRSETTPSEPSISSIDAHFKNPPDRYGIRCWWWWLNSNVTEESITRDLEEMKAKGFSGACLYDSGGADIMGNGAVPEGPMFGSPAWRKLYLHAIREADRLGLELSFSIQSGFDLGAPDVTPEEAAKRITWSELKVNGPVDLKELLPQPETNLGYYRDIAVLAIPVQKKIARPGIRDLSLKAVFHELGGSAPDTRYLLTDIAPTAGEEDAELNQVIDLTGRYNKNGLLEWTVPPGEWLIMRFGYTPTGSRVQNFSGQWQGLVLDYMSEKYFNRYWDTHVEPFMKAIGPLAGKTLRYLQTDSWELGGINWTDKFQKEFQNRRGYDLTPYLPIVAGKIIENRDVSNRFLADLRKTISDCIAENHYGTFAEKAKAYGMGIQPESAGPHAGPFDGLKNYGYSEVMMGEFWSECTHRSTPDNRFFVKQAASAAHIFNKKLIGAESFTTQDRLVDGKSVTTQGPHWNDIIWADMKPGFDHEICSGLNLVYLHTFTASPKEMGLPGQEYCAGTHFNPNVTWWNWSGAFINYMTRCQFLMQQGEFIADVLYYYGDHVPNVAGQKHDDPAGALPGFDFDFINEDILRVLSVHDGKITLPHRLSYRVLVLPDHKVLSLLALQQVKRLVNKGATVIGAKPESTKSLVGYPTSEEQLKSIANELWGNANAKSGKREVGKGRIIWGKTAREVLLEDGVSPDFVATSSDTTQVFDYIHHNLQGMDYYFVSSQNKAATRVNCTFRVGNKQPELWDPKTGEIRKAKAFRQSNGETTIPLEFDPYGSVFVVFREPVTEVPSATTNYLSYSPVATIKGPWEVMFDSKWGGPESVTFDSLQSWTTRKEEGIRYYSGKAVYRKIFDAPDYSPASDLYLDLGEVHDVGVARIFLNAKDLGIVWSPPFRVNITDVVLPKNNKLEIEVVNSWRNRLVGDRGKPESERFTKTNVKIWENWQLLPSGLLGPVQIFTARNMEDQLD